MGKLFFSLQIFVLILLSWRLAASSPFHKSPIWDAIFSWTLNPLSGAVSKICWLTTQHTEDMTTQKFLPFLLGLVLLPDYVSLLWLTLPCPDSECSRLPVPAPALFPPHSCLCYLATVAPAFSSHEHSQPLKAALCLLLQCLQVWQKMFYTALDFHESCLCCKRPPCAWALARLNEWWSQALYPFYPSSCFPSLSNSSEKSSLQLPALRHIWPCPIHLHLSSFVRMRVQRCRIDPYPAVPAHSAVNLAGNWCSYHLQPFILDNACLSPGLCFCYFLLLSLPHSAAWALSCPGCHPAYAEPWVRSPAEFLRLGSALSGCCFCSMPCHEQQLLWFLSGHGAVWRLP